MPKLPSGRHIAFGYDALKCLVEDASSGLRYDELFSISDIGAIASYIDVIFFKESCLDGNITTEGTQYHPAGLVPYDSGLTLITLAKEMEHWTEADIRSYRQFMDSSQMNDWLQELFDIVRQTKIRTFYLCEECLSKYRGLIFDHQAKVESNYTPLECIVWLDEQPDGVPVAGIHDNCRYSIIKLSNARKSLWRNGHVDSSLIPTWNAALMVIPDWPGFKRLSVSDDLLDEVTSCEEGWKYMVSKFEEFNLSQKQNKN